ncbi:hypothetical protein HBI25_020010 [Parastagonospora nodorum]|nr:hypothetical protein HBI09_173450 [Parastagonospora nodorum]KAH4045336.1 hypothetical protein HBH49_202710 [Parastagonospora nodorum]KAH4178949.1 hypothetical protein HBH43_030830 [Parastagonospora nodorum]KAH4207264.1 hypothetical protein HBI95_114500 [Parastagonospora nodorum]KAH4240164.1 hypothetical protein HBI06_032290 [Parastagonospora nodorum]
MSRKCARIMSRRVGHLNLRASEARQIEATSRGHCTRSPNMAGAFRFLDLPKEIRLMVYERLPIKTTHHGDEELTLVYRTLPGISIFTTCHEIYDEAKAILSPRLATIRNQPLQLVASPHDHRRLDSFLECLAASEVNCISLKAIRELIAWTYCDDCHDHYTEHDNLDLPVNTPAQQVCLAVRTTSSLGKTLQDRARDVLHKFYDTYSDVTDTCKFTSCRYLEIEYRLVLLSPDDKALYAEVESPNNNSLAREYFDPSHVFSPIIRKGAGIEQVEWDANWAEGEHIWP